MLAPQGPQARQIAELSWILFGAAAVILLLVAILVFLATVGPDAARVRLARSSSVVVCGLAMPLVVLGAALAYGLWLTRSVASTSGDDAVRIEVTGEQWWWRIAYPMPGGGDVASANEIRIPLGRPVDLTLRSADVIHSFWVPNLAGKVDMIPGRTTRMRVVADRVGVFRGQCAEFCGGPHGLMAFEVVALPPDEFDDWLLAQAADAREPSSPAGWRGKHVFLAAGCGGCHAMRGTAAVGAIGPDLTHLASRRRIGAGTLAASPADLVRFITDSQHAKPGNRMPPFQVLEGDAARAIVTYLIEAH
ncbi:MAG: cytochrome c oxidase subunit II [Alphaproteobacteria bacterium]|nr:cytochrome c oxidase subunit II [Alphaproteobacteria bacterium]